MSLLASTSLRDSLRPLARRSASTSWLRRHHSGRAGAKAALCFLLLLGVSRAFAEAPPLTVFAASSLGDAMREVGVLYERETGWPVRFSFASSGVLARQIEHGAPADAYISASREWMDLAATNGWLDAQSRRVILRNRLVVIQPTDAENAIAAPDDLRNVRRLAIGDPDLVPAGMYARQFLARHGLWSRLQSRLIAAAHVRAAVALVERGEADAAIVFATDARSSPAVAVRFTVDEQDHEPIVYEAAILKDAPRRVAALKLFWLLETPEARAIFERHAFTLP